MKRILLFSLIAACSCQTSKSSSEPNVISVTDTDPEMNEAIATAKRSLHNFDVALTSADSTLSGFAIKQAFRTDNGQEHIWISSISKQGNSYSGIVDNVPQSIEGLEVDDTVVIDTTLMSDWMYVDHDTLKGAYTLRVLRDRMTPEEREQFDQETGLIIED
jgi:uncharacterized protein YegJ (DUF2314 family)